MRLIMMIIVMLFYFIIQCNATIGGVHQYDNNNATIMEYGNVVKQKLMPLQLHKMIKNIKDKAIHSLLFFITIVQDFIVAHLIKHHDVIGFDE